MIRDTDHMIFSRWYECKCGAVMHLKSCMQRCIECDGKGPHKFVAKLDLHKEYIATIHKV